MLMKCVDMKIKKRIKSETVSQVRQYISGKMEREAGKTRMPVLVSLDACSVWVYSKVAPLD